MAKDLVSSSENLAILHTPSSSGVAVADDSFEDACSICLEPFSSDDPASVTSCKHEYHLQCILEWSQRSKECPICWQILGMKDAASQELLAAVENERTLRSRRTVHPIDEDHDINQEAPYMDDSDFEEQIMWHFAAAASRSRYINRRGRQRSSGIGSSQVLPAAPIADVPNVQQMYTSPEERQNPGHGFLAVDSPACSTPHTTIDQYPPSVVPPVMNTVSNSAGNSDSPAQASKPTADSQPRRSSSDFLTLSESIKSRLSTASARYKESISKSTRGFKEKLLARNNSVKELSKGVRREMSAGITEVARMIERIDITSKRSGVSAPLSNPAGGTSNSSHKGKGLHGNESCHGNTGETAHNMSSDAPISVSITTPGRLEVSLTQVCELYSPRVLSKSFCLNACMSSLVEWRLLTLTRVYEL
ncbi:unnamed protein product [Ilex paraguariensis]|uniref:RING-type E3 ubiquitin transferase n=1 Tax=Ilex paraguariensis TaxID=185542 RepID=A0ABC8TVX9_9AQUA